MNNEVDQSSEAEQPANQSKVHEHIDEQKVRGFGLLGKIVTAIVCIAIIGLIIFVANYDRFKKYREHQKKLTAYVDSMTVKKGDIQFCTFQACCSTILMQFVKKVETLVHTEC